MNFTMIWRMITELCNTSYVRNNLETIIFLPKQFDSMLDKVFHEDFRVNVFIMVQIIVEQCCDKRLIYPDGTIAIASSNTEENTKNLFKFILGEN